MHNSCKIMCILYSLTSCINFLLIANYDDYEPVNEVGEITSRTQTFCHNITIIDDNLVESLEDVDVMIVQEFNVASVFLSPDISTITIDDDDSESKNKLYLTL